MNKHEIVHLDPKKLIPWDKNPRKHNMEQLKNSIERFGFRNVIVVNKTTNTIEAGHGRAKAAVELGIKEVPVMFVEDSEMEAIAFAIADNKQSELGSWDEEMLGPLLKQLEDSDALDFGVGFSDAELDDLLRRTQTTLDDVQGPSWSDYLEVYENGVIRQIMLFYNVEQYEEILSKTKGLMEQQNIDNHSELFVFLLENYLNSRSNAFLEPPSTFPSNSYGIVSDD